jgi:hypothetical protein
MIPNLNLWIKISAQWFRVIHVWHKERQRQQEGKVLHIEVTEQRISDGYLLFNIKRKKKNLF